MERAQVLDVGLQDQVRKALSQLQPRPSIYDPDFIAANQVKITISCLKLNPIIPILKIQLDRADNLIKGTRQEQFEQIRRDIR